MHRFLIWALLFLFITRAANGRDAPSRLAIHLEAEKAVLTANAILSATPGFTGSGYAGDFSANGAKILWTIPHARSGLYDVKIRCRTPFGPKGYDLSINGRKTSGKFADTGGKFVTQAAGKAELRDGANTIEIDRGWGYFEIDSLDLVPSGSAPPLAKPSGTLSDPLASTQARALMRSLLRSYGSKTLSGQYNLDDIAYIHATTGRTPAILGSDLMDYSASRLAHGTKPDGTTERIVEAARTGLIVTLVWHWNAPADLIDTPAQPWYKGFYTAATTFNLQQALDHPGSDNYKLLLKDIDAIAAELQKYSDAGVPVLWRPLHEAEGGWFWWGAKGPEPFKQLWRLMHQRLTQTHHLHNLIWVYSSGTNPQWYPGDDVVDIVGIDEYPADVADPCAQDWDTLLKSYGGRKPLALSEFGGVPDIARMHRYGVRWLYFVTWGHTAQKMPPADVLRIYAQPSVVTRAAPPLP